MQDADAPLTSKRGEPTELNPAEKLELIDRILNGREFSRAPALRSFLSYVVKYAILGQPEKLKEQIIGLEVLGRQNYDPAVDNIVRVRAHELRTRLKKHFEAEGANESFVVTIPKGAYVPEFAARVIPNVLPTLEAASGSDLQPAMQVERSTMPPKTARAPRFRLFLTGTAFIAVILTTILVTRYLMRAPLRSTVPAAPSAIEDMWGQFFVRPGEELRVVNADTSFGLWQDLNKKTLDLGAYLSHKYLENETDKLREVATRPSTSPADVSISVKLATLAGRFGGRVLPQFARTLNAEFLHGGNIVLIGSHRANPWVSVYEPNLNFQLEQNPATGAPLYANRSPRAGEAKSYTIPNMLDVEGDEVKEFPTYGVIALLKICNEQGFVLLTGGLNMQATQAVGDMVTNPQDLDVLLHTMGHKSGTNVAPFEALIQMTSLPGGGYDSPKVVAFRTRSSDACVGR